MDRSSSTRAIRDLTLASTFAGVGGYFAAHATVTSLSTRAPTPVGLLGVRATPASWAGLLGLCASTALAAVLLSRGREDALRDSGRPRGARPAL